MSKNKEIDRSYRGALEAAGAKVLAFEEFGSYQGDWYAKVEYEGKTGWIRDYFGSCSGCDALEAEFGYGDLYSYKYEDGVLVEKSPEEMAVAHKRFADFGAEYLKDLSTYEDVLKEAGRNSSWDMDSDKMVAWIKSVEGK